MLKCPPNNRAEPPREEALRPLRREGRPLPDGGDAGRSLLPSRPHVVCTEGVRVCPSVTPQ